MKEKMVLPNFTFESYQNLLVNLLNVGYRFRCLSDIPHVSEDLTIYLRHDLDFHLNGLARICELESHLQINATYYVLLTEHYNVLHPQNVRILRHIIACGHEIGLHYDLSLYPTTLEAAHQRLEWEISMLSEIVQTPIKTIATHQPFRGLPDPFRASNEYIHPHDERYQTNLMYISDSTRSWRDENLLACFSASPPQRLMLNFHPEFWLGDAVQDRWTYAQEKMMSNINELSATCLNEQQKVWRGHIATRLHDQRGQAKENHE